MSPSCPVESLLTALICADLIAFIQAELVGLVGGGGGRLSTAGDSACLGGRLPPAPHLLRLRPPRAWGSRWIISRRRAAGLGYTSWPPHGHHGRSVFDWPVTHLNDVSRAGHIESNDEVSWITAQAARPWLIREPRAVRCPDKEAHRGVESRSNRQAVHQVRGVLCEVYS
eukprot:COSAG01_NODE_8763_length_2667_cov_9.123442_4_plen_170_part_00